MKNFAQIIANKKKISKNQKTGEFPSESFHETKRNRNFDTNHCKTKINKTNFSLEKCHLKD
jgi:hypothetical protein